MAINLEFLKNEVKQNITKNSATVSPLSILGATPISYGVTSLISHSIGGSATVFEGGVKPETEAKKVETDVKRGKQVILLTETQEAVKNDTERVMASLASQAVSQIVADLDLVILNGTDRATGQAITKFADSAIAPNATKVEATGGNIALGGDLATILQATNLASPGLILANHAFNDIAYAQKDGIRIYPEATSNGAFNYFTANALAVPGFGYDISASDGFSQENGNLALAGNFANVYRNIQNVDIKTSTEATIGGVSMFETNQQAFIFEVEYTFAVVDNAKFVLLEEAETP